MPRLTAAIRDPATGLQTIVRVVAHSGDVHRETIWIRRERDDLYVAAHPHEPGAVQITIRRTK